MSFGSLFSGVGGADMGLVASGMTPAWACEIDKKARAVYRRHFPGVPIYHDVKEMKGHALQSVDVLFFGSPCQDLSVAGKRAGLSGARSGLFFEAMRICDEMAAPPRIVVWENVRGALSSNDGRDFGAVLTEVGKRWGGVAYRVLDLQYFGPPQRRSRVFVVGHSGGWQRAAEILFEPKGVRWNPPARREAGKAAPTIPCRSTGGGGLGTDFDCDGGLVSGPLMASGKAAGSATQQDAEMGMLVAYSTKLHNTKSNQAGKFYEEYAPSLQQNSPAPEVCAFDTTQITSAANYSNPKPGDACHPLASSSHAPAIAFPANLSGTQCASAEELAPSMGAKNPTAVAFQPGNLKRQGGASPSEEVFPTLSASPGNGRGLSDQQPHVAHAMQVRRLTPIECHRLMGWPDDWCAWGIDDEGNRVEMADGPQYKMIGNGVGKPHAKWIGRRIMADAPRVAS
ncbi:MAG: hypothetical protein FD177_1036 [Desulfovibrionaceae bacterium]|nr:MAG: hypothetical protein FD177_1036 [Desulfovibrionaceae bacterium]